MSDFSAFFKENVIVRENVKIPVSDRILDKDGKPVEWEIRALSISEDENIQKDCQIQIPVPGKRGVFTTRLDTPKYVRKLAVACTVYPDLHDQDLQNNYGVMGAEALLAKMLLPGEYAAYLDRIQEICGYDESLGELEEEAKNY